MLTPAQKKLKKRLVLVFIGVSLLLTVAHSASKPSRAERCLSQSQTGLNSRK
ncbi:hypothetical protein LEP3755_30470 [Leptolyngbya sp. NIES-3755]|nr:hypothetical protein LEP3755_30470 [Leptolyngbya sp. NIES-3755]